nr:hypothetical protein [Tanacetum cinerariifolium]
AIRRFHGLQHHIGIKLALRQVIIPVPFDNTAQHRAQQSEQPGYQQGRDRDSGIGVSHSKRLGLVGLQHICPLACDAARLATALTAPRRGRSLLLGTTRLEIRRPAGPRCTIAHGQNLRRSGGAAGSPSCRPK